MYLGGMSSLLNRQSDRNQLGKASTQRCWLLPSCPGESLLGSAPCQTTLPDKSGQQDRETRAQKWMQADNTPQDPPCRACRPTLK